jgi:hypothetical protein
VSHCNHGTICNQDVVESCIVSGFAGAHVFQVMNSWHNPACVTASELRSLREDSEIQEARPNPMG